MKVWVLTGPAGGGKSLAASELETLGAVVIDADRVGHEVLRRDDVVDAVAREFGAHVVVEGEVDRPALGRLVFAEPDRLAALNALTHPHLSAAVAARLEALGQSDGRPHLAVVEAAVYFLLPPFGDVDLTVCVTASEDVRLERLTRSGRLGHEAATARIRAQRPLLRDWEASDIVLRNESGADQLRAAIRDLHHDRIRRERP